MICSKCLPVFQEQVGSLTTYNWGNPDLYNKINYSVENQYLPPALEGGGLENRDDSLLAAEGGEEGKAFRLPGELSTLLSLEGGGEDTSSLEERAFLVEPLAAEIII